LAELLAQARPSLEALTEPAGFALQIDCAESLHARADPDALTQILINLVDNGVKFSGKNDAALRSIEIHCAPDDRDGALLSVRDHGPGIARQHRRRALGLFQRLENEATRETRGTGIGLALVQRLASAMGGRVELDDAKPGLVVRLWLPPARP
jgi:signal transduction histidine kinase